MSASRRGDIIAVWRLTPLYVDSPAWKFSKIRTPVIVCAGGEIEARKLVSDYYCVGAIVSDQEVEIGNPWASSITARCTKVDQDAHWAMVAYAQVLWCVER